MDLLKRIVTWLRGDHVDDPERAITNEIVEPENLNLGNVNLDFNSLVIPPGRTCNCQARLTALEVSVDRLTSRVFTLRERINRNDVDIENMMNFIRRCCAVEYSPTYLSEEQETIPEQFVNAGAVQRNRNESPVVSDQEARSEQNQNEALNGSGEQSIIQSVPPSPQDVLSTPRQENTNRINRNITVAQCYKMDYKNRGVCIVFTHEHFKNTRLQNRHSATKEARMIETTYRRLGFRVKVCQDYTYSKIRKQLRELKSLVHPDDDCISICISTHGQEDVLWALDCDYPLDIFENTLSKIRKLIGKPKMIFIQACRGKKIDRGVSSNQDDFQTENETDNLIDSKKHPSRADFVIVHSTPYGYVSWRNWFFMALCHTLDRFSEKDDIDEILRKTKRQICAYESRCDGNRARAKQVPTVYSTLTRRLFLKRK